MPDFSATASPNPAWVAAKWSHHFRERLGARPELNEAVAAGVNTPITRAVIQQWAQKEAPAPEADPTEALAQTRRQLRRLRDQVYCILMERDLRGVAPLEEVTGAMTALAELATEQALRAAAGVVSRRHGVPRRADGSAQELIILGMGKLGGEELNVSSDIDLIMLYADEGQTDGVDSISFHEWYVKVTQLTLSVLAARDADGYVFRTDLRLRPDGDGGPLAWSFGALETYLITQGREWERYAWLKGRILPVRAWPDSICEPDHVRLERLRLPFVYRNYFDFDALAALRALRERIAEDWGRRAAGRAATRQAPHNHIKLGPGGIREVEFIVQLFQLVRGGRQPELQVRPLLAALAVERRLNLLGAEEAGLLDEAYRYLRRVEHVLQYRDDQQTHLLPEDDTTRGALAEALGAGSVAAFDTSLQRLRDGVHAIFNDVFHRLGPSGTTQPPLTLPIAGPAPEERDLALTTLLAGFGTEAALCRHHIDALLHDPRNARLPDLSRQRLHGLIPLAVQASLATEAPAAALARLMDLFAKISQRSAYLALLAEYPEILSRLARMLAASEWAAQFLMRFPVLLDEFIGLKLRDPLENLPAVRAALQRRLDAHRHGDQPDVERQMDVLRDVQNEQVLHLLALDLEGEFSVERLSDQLSLLADLLIDESLNRCWTLLYPDDPQPPRFAVIAYGKLGGKELGYASDLDLVFLFDDDRPDAAERYGRLAQRLCTWLTATTASGRLYAIDLRLRPDGQAGLLVSSLEGFSDYQRHHAWVWEHQALTRARFCAGDLTLGARFENLRRDILCLARDPYTLTAAVRDMRARMADGHPNRSDRFDLKHDPGGMVDLEFVVQTLILRDAVNHAWLLDNKGNIGLLLRAGECGLIDLSLARAASEAYRSMRRAQHTLRLQGQTAARVSPDRFVAERAAVRALWMQVMNPAQVA